MSVRQEFKSRGSLLRTFVRNRDVKYMRSKFKVIPELPEVTGLGIHFYWIYNYIILKF